MMDARLVSVLLVCLALLRGGASQQDAPLCSSNPGVFAVPAIDYTAFASDPWYLQQLLPIASLTAPSLYCLRTVLEPLSPQQASAGFTVTTTAAMGGPSGALVPVDVFNVAGATASPAVSAFQGPTDSQDNSAALAQGTNAGQVVLKPIQGGRMGATLETQLSPNTDPSQLAPIWIAAVGQRPLNLSTTTNTSYNWAVLLAGPPPTPSACGGCTYPLLSAASGPSPPSSVPIVITPTLQPAPAPPQPPPAPPPISTNSSTTPTVNITVKPRDTPPSAPPASVQLPVVNVSVTGTGSSTTTGGTGTGITGTTTPDNGTIQVVVLAPSQGPLSTLSQRVSEAVSNAADKANQVAGEIQDKIQETRERIQAKVEEIHNRVSGALDRLFGRDSPPCPPSPPPLPPPPPPVAIPVVVSTPVASTGRRRLWQQPPVPAPANATAAPPPECAATNLACGCNTNCSSALKSWPANALLQGGLWIFTHQPDDDDSVAEARRVASEVLGVDISGLVAVCQQGCWEPK